MATAKKVAHGSDQAADEVLAEPELLGGCIRGGGPSRPPPLLLPPFGARHRIARDGRRAPVLELRGITKRFPGIVANDHIDLDLRRGEVHALLGENGAGKSTLMNVLYGLYRPDEGEILLNGEPVVLKSAKDAIDRGIGMVHQHFMLIPVMTVAENIVLANEPTHAGIMLDYTRRERSASASSPRSSSSRSTRTR